MKFSLLYLASEGENAETPKKDVENIEKDPKEDTVPLPDDKLDEKKTDEKSEQHVEL